MQISRYAVELKGYDILLGGLPENTEALKYMATAGESETAREVLAEKEEEGEELIERAKCVFRRNQEGKPCVDEHHIKALFRETIKKLGENRKGPLKGAWMAFHTCPYLLPVEGEMVEEIRAFRVWNPRPASVVTIHEGIKAPVIKFILEIHGLEIGEEKLEELLTYGGRYVGLGAGRGKSGIHGIFGLFNVVAFKKL